MSLLLSVRGEKRLGCLESAAGRPPKLKASLLVYTKRTCLKKEREREKGEELEKVEEEGKGRERREMFIKGLRLLALYLVFDNLRQMKLTK